MNIPLLFQLEQAQGEFVNASLLGADPLEVMRDLEELESFGFALERHPILGAAYRGPSERLCPDLIEYDTRSICIGRRIAVWNRVSSTNDVAARAGASVANEGLVVLAEEQTAGRGSRGRSWTAPARSSLLMSVLLFPAGPLADPAWLTALAALAVAEVVSESTGREARIKWPNDVRVDGRKVAGILVERGRGSVIGIGLNVNITEDQFDEAIRTSATSLSIILRKPVDRSSLARALIARLDALYERSRRFGPEMLIRRWSDRGELVGRSVTVETAAGCRDGKLIELDIFHALMLEAADGSRIKVPLHRVLSITPGPNMVASS